MEPTDLTIAILREIRDEIRGTNTRIDGTNERLDRLEGRVESLERRSTELELRVATELIAVAKSIDGVKSLLKRGLDVREKVERHEQRISGIEHRLGI